MLCDYCGRAVSNTFRVIDVGGMEEQVCRECAWDVEYAKSGGRIPQNPEDA